MPFTNIPAATTTNNQRGTVSPPTTTQASITAANIATAKDRLMLTIFNESNGTLLIKYGGTAANTAGSFDLKIYANTIYEFPGPTLPPNTAISGLWLNPATGTLTGNCIVFETI
ncbi:hypothetical protein NIES2119_08100 [[Phormidium ambiguum] IAM M-71]|uniref:Uncharacterized protein n=1 Tax=[Phormidium ambiguum] IAM M-71 TaxID=454136 RepID=A0A1U7IP85_9CYAN|nr:hypothetical protein [Phormidium ambiguum]OKH39082.1 hypothetical protein NIES2119_08100 [Phormidium ambiguum IAM M-71]